MRYRAQVGETRDDRDAPEDDAQETVRGFRPANMDGKPCSACEGGNQAEQACGEPCWPGERTGRKRRDNERKGAPGCCRSKGQEAHAGENDKRPRVRGMNDTREIVSVCASKHQEGVSRIGGQL
jgi:hypothetical protein